jgi:phosphoribosylanthranilate isomerase
MPTGIKICGLSDRESVDAALEAGADFLGFVFFPKSPRNVSIDAAVPLMRRAARRAARVALLVDPDQQLLDDVVCTLDPDFLQLHGAESPERVAWIRAEYDTPVIKAVGIGSPADLDIVGPLRGRGRSSPSRRQAAA